MNHIWVEDVDIVIEALIEVISIGLFFHFVEDKVFTIIEVTNEEGLGTKLSSAWGVGVITGPEVAMFDFVFGGEFMTLESVDMESANTLIFTWF